jgi:(p)ppGpp synthase/HD superfamily hydrolase
MAVSRELAEVPGFPDAHAYLREAYARRLRRAGRNADHPRRVAHLLAADGQPDAVVVAGLLHDVLEDTDVTRRELADRFGTAVAGFVVALTQDESIAQYSDRKADLRRRSVGAGRDAAQVALADKIDKLASADRAPRPRKLRHYRATWKEVEARYGESALSRRLRDELARWPGP